MSDSMRQCPICEIYYKTLDHGRCRGCGSTLLYVGPHKKTIITEEDRLFADVFVRTLTEYIKDAYDMPGFSYEYKQENIQKSMAYMLINKSRKFVRGSGLAIKIHPHEFLSRILYKFFYTKDFDFLRGKIFSLSIIGGTLFPRAALSVMNDIKLENTRIRVQQNRLDNSIGSFAQEEIVLAI